MASSSVRQNLQIVSTAAAVHSALLLKRQGSLLVNPAGFTCAAVILFQAET
jgi:hypothetical protein